MAFAAVYEGDFSAKGMRFVVLASRFNSFIVEPLIAGAYDALVRHGADPADISLVRVPGAWELAGALNRLITHYDGPGTPRRPDAFIVLGAVIRGATPHFDYVAGEAAKGVGAAAAAGRYAVSFGVLTTDTIEQAVERAGTKAGNKGFDAAVAAVETASLYRRFPLAAP